MGYGTGAIMAVPGQDERDWEFAERFDLPIVRTVQPPDGWEGDAYLGDGPAINSANATLDLNGMDVAAAKRATIDWLVANGHGEATTTYRLRDWLFSRQRYWGEPFPIVFDETGLPVGLPESMLPVTLPPLDDFRPRTLDPDDAASEPELPLSRVDWWATTELDLGDGPKRYQRELNVMPQWAGSCWYELRYLDPTNENRFVDPEVERYWMGPQREGDPGGVDLYVGGVEHAVLHLLYARFWHKVLFDLGHVSSWEPYRRLFNQGYILAAAFKDDREIYVDALAVEEQPDGSFTAGGRPVTREWGKMGKSLKNAVGPDDIYADYGADTLRLYEMSMGPFDTSRPWGTRDIVGYYRFLQKLWRNLVDETDGASRVVDEPADDATRRILHRTIDAVSADYDGLRFNTAIAKLIELNNHLTKVSGSHVAREVAEPLVLMMAPVTPHVAEELWARLGHAQSLAFEPFPVADPALLVDDVVEYPVQVNGKVRGPRDGRRGRPAGRRGGRGAGRRQGGRRRGRPGAEEGDRGPRPPGQHRRLSPHRGGLGSRPQAAGRGGPWCFGMAAPAAPRRSSSWRARSCSRPVAAPARPRRRRARPSPRRGCRRCSPRPVSRCRSRSTSSRPSRRTSSTSCPAGSGTRWPATWPASTRRGRRTSPRAPRTELRPPS